MECQKIHRDDYSSVKPLLTIIAIDLLSTKLYPRALSSMSIIVHAHPGDFVWGWVSAALIYYYPCAPGRFCGLKWQQK